MFIETPLVRESLFFLKTGDPWPPGILARGLVEEEGECLV